MMIGGNMLKRILESRIFIFILGAVIFGFVGAYAASVASSEVSYDNSNSGSSATTVEAAIDDLYTKTNVGDVTTADIIMGKSALSHGHIITGEMVDNSGWNAELEGTTNRITIPAGYHDGTGYVDGSKLANSNCNVKINYHQHKTSCYCNGDIVARPHNNGDDTSYVTYQCSRCGQLLWQDGVGQGAFWDYINQPSGTPIGQTHQKLICGKSTSTIESFTAGGVTYTP